MTTFQTFKQMIGKTMVDVHQSAADNDTLYFRDEAGDTYTFTHRQDCCESVFIEDVAGDLADLVGSPILMAEEVSTLADEGFTEEDEIKEAGGAESFTWTFYKFATAKGHVTVRFFGSSNGYYSEGVSFDTSVKDEASL